MKTDIQPKGIRDGFCGSWTVMIAAGVLLALACNTEAASKSGGGGATKDQPINVQFWLDDFHTITVFDPLPVHLSNLALPNRVVGDGNFYASPDDDTLPTYAVQPPYRHGQDRVSAQIMPDQKINVHTAQFNKPALRYFTLSSGFPEVMPASCAPAGLGAGDLRKPSFSGSPIPISMFQIYGKNHDDTPVGIIRHVHARLVMTDDAGRTWTVPYGSRPGPDGFTYAPCVLRFYTTAISPLKERAAMS